MVQYHTGWQRFIALWIDSFIISALTDIISWFAIPQFGVVINLSAAIAYSVVPVAYSVYMHGRFGQTLGKFFMRVKVIGADGRRISYEQAILRDIVPCLLLPISMWFSLYTVITGTLPNTSLHQAIQLSLLPLYILWILLEMVTMLFNEERRAIHDFIARTVVVRAS